MLKNIFGRRKEKKSREEAPASNDLLDQLVTQSQREGLGKLYPILKPPSWIARPHAVYIPWVGDEDNAQVLIAFGFDAGENLTFLTKQKALGMKKSEIYDLAIKNIGDLPSTITLSDVQGHLIATASGQDFSAEKILDPNFLLELCAKLDSNEIIVSVPRRRCLMACSRNSPDEHLHRFQALHNDAWLDDSYGNAPIANGIFEVTKGAVSSFIPL